MLSLTKERQHICIYVYKLLFTNRITTVKCLPIETRKEYRYREQRKFSEYTLYRCDVRISEHFTL